MRQLACSLVILALVGPGVAGGEIYRWTDAQGREHFTQDLGQVPAGQRAAAEAAASRKAKRDPIQRISPPASIRRSPRARSVSGDRVYQIPVERAGTSMRVVALLEGRVRAPFIIDTGASDVLIPGWVADELGIQVTAETRTQIYQTANGLVEQPVVTLDSIDLGGAVAEDVAASIGQGMPVGLLGLSYFNRFHYQIDPARGLVTLRHNDLADSGVIRGGRSESEWRSEFRQLHGRLSMIEARMARLTPAHTRLLETLDGEKRKLEEQIDELEAEADRAEVPHAWRQ